MIFLIVVGVISLVFGILFLCSPETVRNLSNMANKVIVDLDEKSYSRRVWLGVFLILFSAVLFLLAYSIVRK